MTSKEGQPGSPGAETQTGTQADSTGPGKSQETSMVVTRDTTQTDYRPVNTQPWCKHGVGVRECAECAPTDCPQCKVWQDREQHTAELLAAKVSPAVLDKMAEFRKAYDDCGPSQENEGYCPDRGDFKMGFFAAWDLLTATRPDTQDTD